MAAHRPILGQCVHRWWHPATVATMLTFGQRVPGAALPPPAPSWAGVGTGTLAGTSLAATPARLHRLGCHLLALTTAGHGTAEVDFAPRLCRPGSLLWVRPHQALRFDGNAGLDAALVTWQPGVLSGEHLAGMPVDDPAGPSRWQLAGEDEDAVISEFTQLSVDCGRHASGPVAAALLRHQLAVLLLRLALLPADDTVDPGTAEGRTFARFRRALEDGHRTTRRVEDYADRLGCSVRTLTRACLAVTGRTAKQIVDDRVALEARRLLACTDLSVAEIGRRLGFGEPTNFGRFFHRESGMSPGAFRGATPEHRTRAELPAPGLRVPGQRRPPD